MFTSRESIPRRRKDSLKEDRENGSTDSLTFPAVVVTMTLTSGKWRDPELEAIRNSVRQPPRNENLIEDLIRKNRDVHVSFLFGPEGHRLRKDLCLALSSTKETPIYSGWEAFGHHLGIHPQLIGCMGCDYNFQDPTYNIFRAYAQEEHATVGNIIEALRKLGRFDIITKTSDLFNEFADEVHQKYRPSDESGYLSISEGRYDREGTVGSSNECSEDDIQQSIIKSPYTPKVPDIYKSHSEVVLERCTAVSVPTLHVKQEQQQLVRASPNTVKTRGKATKSKYGMIVMLTFASDGYEAAKEVAKVMREKKEGLPRVGVLMLQEQVAALAKDDQLFISGSFYQVDYVIPIITRQYLESVIATDSDNSDSTCVDAKYARYIYTLMNTHFINSGCLNVKCRCIIPDDFLHTAVRHPLLNNEPLFKVWKKLSETNEFCNMLLRATLHKRKQMNFSS